MTTSPECLYIDIYPTKRTAHWTWVVSTADGTWFESGTSLTKTGAQHCVLEAIARSFRRAP